MAETRTPKSFPGAFHEGTFGIFTRSRALSHSPAGALRRSLCLPGEDINLLQTNSPSWQSDSFSWGRESGAKLFSLDQINLESTQQLPYSHKCIKLAILKIPICHKTNKSTFFWLLSDFHTLQLWNKKSFWKELSAYGKEVPLLSWTASPWKQCLSTPWEVTARPELSSANLLVVHEPQNNPAPSPWLYRFH